MKKIKCSNCGGKTLYGDLISGGISFGNYFIEYDEDKKTVIGTPKPKKSIQKDNRVVSFVCTKCGLISSFLEKIIKEKK